MEFNQFGTPLAYDLKLLNDKYYKHGFISVSINEDSIFLDMIFVKPEFRNQGIGKQMMNGLIEISKKYHKPLQLQICSIYFDEGNDEILEKFYTDLGFKKVESEIPNLFQYSIENSQRYS